MTTDRKSARCGDWTERRPHLAAAVTSLASGSTIIDAEVVATDADGLADFAALHIRLASCPTAFQPARQVAGGNAEPGDVGPTLPLKGFSNAA